MDMTFIFHCKIIVQSLIDLRKNTVILLFGGFFLFSKSIKALHEWILLNIKKKILHVAGNFLGERKIVY